jgi:mRNA interferase MazF
MDKNFDEWNTEKKNISNKETPLFNEGDIWACHVGLNVGFEQDGKGNLFLRPVLILKKFNRNVFWGIPMTHSLKENIYLHSLKYNPTSKLILSQIKLIDARRLKYRIGAIGNDEKFTVKEKIKKLLS